MTERAGGSGRGAAGWLGRQYGRRGILKMAILAAVTVAVLASLLYRIDVADLVATLGRADPAMLACAALLALVLGPAFGSLRWFLLLRASGERVALATCVRILYASLPANVLTPTRAGDLLRSVFMRGSVDVWKGMGVVLTERLVDLAVLSCMALAGGLAIRLGPVTVAAAAALALAVAVFVAAVLGIRLPLGERWGGRVRHMLEGARALARRPGWLVMVACASALLWTTNLAITAILFSSMGSHVGIVRVAAAMPVAIFVGLVPVTLCGMGTRDSAMVLLFAGAAPEATSLGVGFLYSLLLYWLLAIVGLPFLRSVLASGVLSRDGTAGPDLPRPEG